MGKLEETKNFFANLLKKNKSRNFCNLNINDLNDNKKFWKKN